MRLLDATLRVLGYLLIIAAIGVALGLTAFVGIAVENL